MNSLSVRLHQAKTDIQYVFIFEIVKAYLKLLQYLHLIMITRGWKYSVLYSDVILM